MLMGLEKRLYIEAESVKDLFLRWEFHFIHLSLPLTTISSVASLFY